MVGVLCPSLCFLLTGSSSFPSGGVLSFGVMMSGVQFVHNSALRNLDHDNNRLRTSQVTVLSHAVQYPIFHISHVSNCAPKPMVFSRAEDRNYVQVLGVNDKPAA